MAESEQRRVVSIPDTLPVLPLRDLVIYPTMVAPILVGQERSVRLVHDVVGKSRLVALVAQRGGERRATPSEDLYRVGTVAMIHELAVGQDSTLRIAVQGLERIRLGEPVQLEPFLSVRIRHAP